MFNDDDRFLVDGTPHPTHPTADAVAWTGARYIEFMESAFKGKGLDSIRRLIPHEKAHFLWEYLFDDQLKQDWIEIGGWFENPDVPSGWSTTKQVEFVSAYAHAKNPNKLTSNYQPPPKICHSPHPQKNICIYPPFVIYLT